MYRSINKRFGLSNNVERNIKPGKKSYEPFTDEVIYFWNYTVPEDIVDARYEKFRFNGFDMLPITNSIVQTGKSLHENYIKYNGLMCNSLQLLEFACRGNVEKYGYECGALSIPSIVMYNKQFKCYYGLVDIGSEYYKHKYLLTKYDEYGRLISSRTVCVSNSTIIEDESTCNKKLYEFVLNMIDTYTISAAARI